VVGISVDPAAQNRAWAEKLKLPFRLLSDVEPAGKVGRQFGVFEETWGLDGRATFVIDKTRTIRFVDAASLALDPARTLAAVKRLSRPDSR
jgi:peroxiredoxin